MIELVPCSPSWLLPPTWLLLLIFCRGSAPSSCPNSTCWGVFSQCLMRARFSRDSQSATAPKCTLGVTRGEPEEHSTKNSPVGCILRASAVTKWGGWVSTWPASADIASVERHDRPTWSAATGQARVDAPLDRFLCFSLFSWSALTGDLSDRAGWARFACRDTACMCASEAAGAGRATPARGRCGVPPATTHRPRPPVRIKVCIFLPTHRGADRAAAGPAM